jgi:hypothetical protein
MDHKHTRGGQDCTERFGEKNSRTVGTPGGNSKSWVLPVLDLDVQQPDTI